VGSLSADAQSARERLLGLGFTEADAGVLLAHFLDAERRGKFGQGLARVAWLETRADLDPRARPAAVVEEESYARWDSRGALGYLTLEAIVQAQLASPPRRSRLIVSDASPTGMLGYWVRRLAHAGLVALLTAVSPRRLGHPAGGPPLTGTNPIAIAVPSSDGRPVVADVSMAAVTHGDVLRGAAEAADIVPFGGDQAHKSFALAVGLQLFCETLAGPDRAAVMLIARPQCDRVPAFRELAQGTRLPGDR
jgi:LDH2 family malate/lactate/ureidoglycolate dehydrogenase